MGTGIVTRSASESHLEALLALQIRAAKLPEPVREFRFHPVRRWRYDFAWLDAKLLCDVQGGLYGQGRHVRAAGYENDAQKAAAAVLLGYRVLAVTAGMIRRGEALQLIDRALK